jgi:hypothetical protein
MSQGRQQFRKSGEPDHAAGSSPPHAPSSHESGRTSAKVPLPAPNAVLCRCSFALHTSFRDPTPRRNLHSHHITALADGGSDTNENTITLCGICHTEWHSIAEHIPGLTFAEWLDIPSAIVLIEGYRQIQALPETDRNTVSISQYHAMMCSITKLRCGE